MKSVGPCAQADVDLMPSPVLEVRRPRGSSRQATSFNARRQSVAIAKNFDLAVAGGRTAFQQRTCVPTPFDWRHSRARGFHYSA